MCRPLPIEKSREIRQHMTIKVCAVAALRAVAAITVATCYYCHLCCCRFIPAYSGCLSKNERRKRVRCCLGEACKSAMIKKTTAQVLHTVTYIISHQI